MAHSLWCRLYCSTQDSSREVNFLGSHRFQSTKLAAVISEPDLSPPSPCWTPQPPFIMASRSLRLCCITWPRNNGTSIGRQSNNVCSTNSAKAPLCLLSATAIRGWFGGRPPRCVWFGLFFIGQGSVCFYRSLRLLNTKSQWGHFSSYITKAFKAYHMALVTDNSFPAG